MMMEVKLNQQTNYGDSFKVRRQEGLNKSDRWLKIYKYF